MPTAEARERLDIRDYHNHDYDDDPSFCEFDVDTGKENVFGGP